MAIGSSGVSIKQIERPRQSCRQSLQASASIFIIDIPQMGYVEGNARASPILKDNGARLAGVTQAQLIKNIRIWIRDIGDHVVRMHNSRDDICGNRSRRRDVVRTRNLKIRSGLEYRLLDQPVVLLA